VHVVLPDGVDDPTRPSGGNTYDRRICLGLLTLGWSLRQHVVPGSWPTPDAAARAALTVTIARIPDGAVVLLDGLIASTVPDVLVPQALRLRLVVLVHMPIGLDAPTGETPDHETGNEIDGRALMAASERAVLCAAAAVVTTSPWTRHLLLERHPLRPGRVHVAEPGVDPARIAPGTPTGGELLCVAAVAPHKGHDVLVAALAMVADLCWRCVFVGALDRDPRFVDTLRRQVGAVGIDDRVDLVGPRTGAALDGSYAAVDLLVLASRAETYGMVVTEALARGLPVIATAVGGLPGAMGRAADGSRPGLLVPPGDAPALAAALRRWLGEPDLRQHLRRAAGERRMTLSDWAGTSKRISRVLAVVAT
jgi:glycosyltransferase involved in cell wall biosynthesis